MIKSFCKLNNLEIIGKTKVLNKSRNCKVETFITISEIENKLENLSREINLIVIEDDKPIIVGMCRIAKVKRRNTSIEDWPLNDNLYKIGNDFLWTYMLRNLSTEGAEDKRMPLEKYSGLGSILYKVSAELSNKCGCSGRIITLSRMNISHKFHLDFGFENYDFETFPGKIPTFQGMYLPSEKILNLLNSPLLESDINFNLDFSPGIFSTKLQSFL